MCHFRLNQYKCGVWGDGLGSAALVVGLVMLEAFSNLCDSMNLLIFMF